jgi:hypothetical protein
MLASHNNLWKKRYNEEFTTNIFGIGDIYQSNLVKLLPGYFLKYMVVSILQSIYHWWYSDANMDYVRRADEKVTSAAVCLAKSRALLSNEKVGEKLQKAAEPLYARSRSFFQEGKFLVSLMTREERERFAALQDRNIDADDFTDLITKKAYEDAKRSVMESVHAALVGDMLEELHTAQNNA